MSLSCWFGSGRGGVWACLADLLRGSCELALLIFFRVLWACLADLHREGFVSLFSHLHGGVFVSLSGWSPLGFERLYKTYIRSILSMWSCDNLAPRVVVRIRLLENHGYQIQAVWTLASMFGWASGVGFERFRIQSSVFHSRKFTES